MNLSNKHILDMTTLTREDIGLILETAESMKEVSERPIKKVPTLRGKTVVLFFHEPSTRTKISFDVAAKRMSADSIGLAASGSSIVKGETLIDTVKNLEAMRPDIVVLRHSAAGAPHMLAKVLEKPAIINAGDGMHAHPTQALLDLMTIKEKKEKIEGLKVSIIGDIQHSRVARSNIIGLNKMGAQVVVSGPGTMIPKGIEKMGARVVIDADEAVKGADVVMMLRIQKERQKGFMFPTEREYARLYGLSPRRLGLAGDDVLVMHPGPINRGVEISPEAADGPWSIILDQVTNGVAVRMAILYLVAGGA